MTMLLRVSEKRYTRILTMIGAAAALGLVVSLVLYAVLSQSDHPAKTVISVGIDASYVGQGVDDGTPVIMHGVKVGEVKEISNLPGSRVRLRVDLQTGPTTGLTDAVGIDFRPSNYFGVTGINLIPADHGQPLRNGSSLKITPEGNFTLQALLYRLGELSHQVVTPRLVNVIERATRYTDALNPLFETMIVVSKTVADVQTVSTEQLLKNAAGISVGFPALADGAISTGDLYLKTYIGTNFDPAKDRAKNPYIDTYDDVLLNNYNATSHELATNPDKFVFGRFQEWLDGAEFDLFSKVGSLLSSHTYELFPVVDQIRVMTDVVPRLLNPEDLGNKLRELRTRLERMYAGSADQRALQVRVLLDQLPGVAAPLGIALGAAE